MAFRGSNWLCLHHLGISWGAKTARWGQVWHWPELNALCELTCVGHKWDSTTAVQYEPWLGGGVCLDAAFHLRTSDRQSCLQPSPLVNKLVLLQDSRDAQQEDWAGPALAAFFVGELSPIVYVTGLSVLICPAGKSEWWLAATPPRAVIWQMLGKGLVRMEFVKVLQDCCWVLAERLGS